MSHETIYRTLFIQARGALKKELLQHLRRTRAMRRSRHHTQKTEIHGQIVGAASISERPASADDRAVPGHWEGDLMFGAHNSQIATLVERQTRYVMQPSGIAEIDRARSDGRWDAAYEGARIAVVPSDLQAALDAEPDASAFFAGLDRANRYAVLWRVQTAMRPGTRPRRIKTLVAMLARGEKIHG